MDEAQLYEWLAQAEAQNPGALQQMIAAGLMGDRMGVEGQNMALGKDLWDTPSAQGQRVGSTYVAASPLEHFATAMSRAMGGQKMRESQATQQELINQKGTGMNALVRAMFQRAQSAQQPPPQPSPFMPGLEPEQYPY